MEFQITALERPAHGCDTERFGYENACRVQAYHQSFPGYCMTPLAGENALAKELGLGEIYVKDESRRFGLNAFKGLGGSYAIGRYIAKRLGIAEGEMFYERLTRPDVRRQLGDITFVTATDGNHGRGVAWTAQQLGQKAVVYMPHGSSPERLANIQALGAEAAITELSYDDAVRYASAQAEKNGWVLVQDTDWEGYTEIPGWIMQGYTTMAWEAVQQLCGRRPTHVFLQAGVGAMSGALTGFFANLYGDGPDAPVVTIVEPEKANCIYRTAAANDGRLHFAEGEMDTIMAGLACGEPCTTGWHMLHDHADYFASVPEQTAARGMRVLGNPLPGDTQVISGESGAVTLGFVTELMRRPELAEWRMRLHLGQGSRVLCL